MASYHFIQGHNYFAGFDKPALISASTIREAVEAEGFEVVGDWACKEIPQLPVQVPGQCGQQWDWLALVRRTGPTQAVELPDRVKWVVDATPMGAGAPGAPAPGSQPPQDTPPPPGADFPPPKVPPRHRPPKAAGGGLLVLALAGAAAWWLLRPR